MSRHRVCRNCGWVHFGVTSKFAEEQVQKFNEYYDSLAPADQKEMYGGFRASIDDYTQCCRCDQPHTHFRDATEAECEAIRGSTISPIIAQ